MEILICSKRINEFNVEATLALFLPYHESPHFAKMVTILHIQYVIALIPLLLLFVDYSL
jgi:U3 small nucleolar RNA-associated protein 10